MSLKYKFDGNNDKEPEKEDSETALADEKGIELFDTASNVRNVCFVEASGKRTFLNYSYLVSGEFSPEESSINLAFTTHSVKLKGYGLEELFEAFMSHQPKYIAAIEKRYAEIKIEGKAFVSEVHIIKNG